MKISGYTIKNRIGAGGQAMVYHAIQESLQRPVALKVLSPLHSDSPEFTARFLNEGRILANLGHSNVITIHDIGVENGLHYLSMELVEGGDLKRRMREHFDPGTVLQYVRSIADCLATAHDKKIVHRDIKPGNVLFRSDGTLLLTDFGIAKRLDSTSDLTLTGTTVGSPHYLSPEQAQGKTLDGRADIYSLGIMTYEMLVGAKPYVGDSDIDTIFKHINEPIPRLPEHLSAYQALIDRMIAKRPEDRFENARALVTYIDRMNVEPASPAAVDLDPGDGAGARPTPARISNIDDGPDDGDTVLAVDQAEDGEEDDTETEVNLKAAAKAPAGRRLFIPVVAACVVAGIALAWLLFGRPSPAPPDTASAGSRPAVKETPRMPADAGTPAAGDDTAEAAGAGKANGGTAAAGNATAGLPDSAGDAAGTEAATGAAAASPPSLVSGTDTEARVASLLASAERALEKFRLTRPEGDNALEYFNEVLALDPANPIAADGYRRIAEHYGVLARSEVRRGDYAKAGDFVERGLSLDPQNPDLLVLRDEIKTAIAQGRTGRTDSGEIKGESPKELYERVKRWFE